MKKKSMITKEIDQSPEIQEALTLYRMIGRAEAFNLIEKISRTARIKMLKTIRDNQLYKSIPDCPTMRSIFEKLGVAKTTGYQELEALEKLGEGMMGLLEELGATSGEMLLLGRGFAAEIEGISFEVIDPDQGEYKIDGRLISIDQDRDLISTIMQKAIASLRLEKQARKGLEAELAEKKEELKKKQAKIEAGEKQLTKAQKVGSLLEETPVGNALFQIASYVRQIEAMELSEADEKRKEIYINRVNNDIIPRLVAKFHSVELGQKEYADRMETRNEFESEEDNS